MSKTIEISDVAINAIMELCDMDVSNKEELLLYIFESRLAFLALKLAIERNSAVQTPDIDDLLKNTETPIVVRDSFGA